MLGFQVSVSMSADTVKELADNGSQLYILRAVESSSRLGRPVVWCVTQDFSVNTPIQVPAGLQVYTSFNPITQGTQIDVAFFADIETGQTLNVGNNALGTVDPNGIAGTVSILNTTQTELTCGLSGIVNGKPSAPFCAFPLFGASESTIIPLDKILLTFSTDLIGIGTVLTGSLVKTGPLIGSLEDTLSSGLLINMAGTSEVSVSFDINQGWRSPGVPVQNVPPSANLVDFLIETPTEP